ncbi:MAG TPA: efflux RND transporter periplasmic adaptor subunit [Puia sp.]|nr:efflux RND transporter periplasmic adaptor subunit [Puia sp.]
MFRSVRPTSIAGVFCALLLTSMGLRCLTACKHIDAESMTRKKQTEATVVDVLVAAPHSITSQVEANGTVVANEYVELHPEISGRIVYLNVPEGARVTQGTVIARINAADLQATLEKAKAQLDLYQKTEERERKLLEINGINQADYDLAVSNVNSTKADIDYTQAQLDKTVIRAPFDGVVGLRQVSPGAYVTPSNIIATVQQVDKMKVDFTIPEQYSSMIHKGSLVDIELDALSNVHRKGLIVATEPQINLSSRNLKVRALLEDGTAHPGAFVKVFVSARTDKKAILVPTNCIIPEDRNNQVMEVKNGLAKLVEVGTGTRQSGNVEITSGVNPGDTVIVTGVLFARPGTPVTIRAVKTLENASPASN